MVQNYPVISYVCRQSRVGSSQLGREGSTHIIFSHLEFLKNFVTHLNPQQDDPVLCRGSPGMRTKGVCDSDRSQRAAEDKYGCAGG
jgi:hypothetical protein